MIRWACATMILLSLAGCDRTPAEAEETRPDWSAKIDGLAPLMSPQEVAIALERHGYRQMPCADRPLLDDPLNQGSDSPCYRAAGRPMYVSLFFIDMTEGRRLAVVNFHSLHGENVTRAGRLAVSRAFAGRLRRWLGPPDTTMPGSAFTSYYWSRPGGQATLPDTISATVGEAFEANVTMTSFYAYGGQRPSTGQE